MSGSDPTAGSGGGGSTGGACPDDLHVVLGSPVPEVLEVISVGDLLDVVSVESPIRGVGAFTLGGDFVGAITKEIVALRECLARGVLYEAEVIEINGGAVSTTVRQR